MGALLKGEHKAANDKEIIPNNIDLTTPLKDMPRNDKKILLKENELSRLAPLQENTSSRMGRSRSQTILTSLIQYLMICAHFFQ